MRALSLINAAYLAVVACVSGMVSAHAEPPAMRGTGDLGIVIERASGSLLIVDTTERRTLSRLEGLGDLSHASAVFSRDGRFAFVFGRDGGITKVDLLTASIAKRIIQAGNSIGGAISDDGTIVAVANYEPGGVKVFDSETLDEISSIPATWQGGQSKVIGLEDAPGRRFVFSLWDSGETWIADFTKSGPPDVTKFKGIGSQPYDALVTGDGRYYVAGLFGEDGLTVLDLWQAQPQPRRFLQGYGRGETALPVYKMPHLESWAVAGERLVLPAVGRHEVLWVDIRSFEEVRRTKVHGQPVFAVARPGGRNVWVNFAHPHNDVVQVLDSLDGRIVAELKPGPAVLHMEFTPRGHEVWVSVRDSNVVQIYDARTFEKKAEIPALDPSGIFFTSRANQTGL